MILLARRARLANKELREQLLVEIVDASEPDINHRCGQVRACLVGLSEAPASREVVGCATCRERSARPWASACPAAKPPPLGNRCLGHACSV